MNSTMQAVLRWAHVIAGILWIGHLYFFNFVNGHVAKALDGPTKKSVVPELMPRALYWFRWGAAWTWITGILLGGLIYYHGKVVFEDPSQGNPWLWLAIVLVIMIVGFLVYNAIMKAIKNVALASAICLALLALVYWFLAVYGRFSGRSLYIHVGLILGTIMAMNVWMVIWPSQRKIIAATAAGTPPDANLVALAGLRSRQNTYMSVPLLFTMISNHYPTMYGGTYRDVCIAAVMLLGFAIVWWLYRQSAGNGPKTY
ncbi:MAG TPA: urate hydroxylase PuuD [Thermoanaerobaculia bacterium]|nr:urate hydroxylase PuuD [Thermoanaerobaculia bacterium]